MKVLRRLVVICAVLGVVWAMTASGQADPTISFTDCASTASPSPLPSVTPPGVSPGPSASPTPKPTTTPAPARTPGPDNCTPKSGSMVYGTQTLGFSVLSDGFQPLKNVKLQVKADDDPGAQDAANALFNAGYNCNNQPNPRQTILVPWDTTSDTPHNGKYEVVVTVDTYANPTCGGSGRGGSATRDNIIVDNAPEAVDAPHILAATKTDISIQWTASTAPDVLRYEIFRAYSGSAVKTPPPAAFQLVGTSTTTTYRDAQITPGVFWYSIVVLRRSVWPADKGSIASPMSASSAPVTIAADSTPALTSGGSSSSGVERYIPLNPIILPQPQNGDLAPVPDAPYSAQLPYGNAPESGAQASAANSKRSEAGATDPRGPVLPVAVGAFLVSAALALGRMPY